MEEKTAVQAWLNTGSKREVRARKMFAVMITIYIVYRLGYAAGMFLARIG